MSPHAVHLGVAALTAAALVAAGALAALLTQPRNPHPHLELLDADGCLCCAPTDHRPGRTR